MIEGFAAFALAWLATRASIFDRPRDAVLSSLMVLKMHYRHHRRGALLRFVYDLVSCPFCLGTHFAWMMALLARPWSGVPDFFLQWMAASGLVYLLTYIAETAETYDERKP